MAAAGSARPAQHQRVEPARDVDQAPAHLGVHGRERVAAGFAGDHAAFLHECLGGEDAALAVLVVDERQPALVEREGLVHVSLAVGLDDGADAVREGAAGHRARGARVQVGQQGDGFLAVPRPFDGIAAQADQFAQLAGGAGGLDLEVGQVLDLLRHAGEEGGGQHRAAGGRILHHDGNVDGVGHAGIERVDLRLGHAEGGAVVGRHHHDHGGAHVLRGAAALGAHAGAVVGGGDDHRHPACDVLQRRAREDFTFGIRQRKLLGKVGQDAQAIDTGIDHEIQTALLAFQVEAAILVERGRHDREDAAVAGILGRVFCWHGVYGCDGQWE